MTVGRRRRKVKKFTRKMRTKLMVLFSLFVLAFCVLIGRIMYIEHTSGEKYQKIVLAQQSFDSTSIPYQRGDIVDTNGTVLATSTAVYNIILDCYLMTVDNGKYIEPTIDALIRYFPELKREDLETYAKEQPTSRYIILARKLPYEKISAFVEMQNETDKDGDPVHPEISGVWFEKEYQRSYPYKTLACSVIGFTSDGDVGTSGLENYYNDILNGTNGREYGYLNSDSAFEKTVIEPKNGQTLVTSIDVNIQSIVEEKIREFAETYRDNGRTGAGAENIAVIVQNPNTGEIKAMADYPSFDCNEPRELKGIFTDEELEKLTDEEELDALNKLWQNFCVSSTYEPGSVQKSYTVAGGIETGKLNTGMTFLCDGYEEVGGHKIRCVNRDGHGTETLEKALMDSCNDALMQMSRLIGTQDFYKYQSVFGFGQKTGIDLPGEANTSSLLRKAEEMNVTDLATYAFGQNYNCTMVQMVSAFSSLINGGTYYQPHIVRKIQDSNGNTVSTVEPVAVKKTISESTSRLLKEYLKSVVSAGTGSMAKVDGYSMGGKTGTAQKSLNGKKLKGEYLVSFLGFVPCEKPQLVIYCVIDEPNAQDQAHSSYAQNLAREILKEVLPYMNIYPDEETTGINENLDITGNIPPKGMMPDTPEGEDDQGASEPPESLEDANIPADTDHTQDEPDTPDETDTNE